MFDRQTLEREMVRESLQKWPSCRSCGMQLPPDALDAASDIYRKAGKPGVYGDVAAPCERCHAIVYVPPGRWAYPRKA